MTVLKLNDVVLNELVAGSVMPTTSFLFSNAGIKGKVPHAQIPLPVSIMTDLALPLIPCHQLFSPLLRLLPLTELFFHLVVDKATNTDTCTADKVLGFQITLLRFTYAQATFASTYW